MFEKSILKQVNLKWLLETLKIILYKNRLFRQNY